MMFRYIIYYIYNDFIKILEEHIENGDFQIIESNIYVDKVNANLPLKGVELILSN